MNKATTTPQDRDKLAREAGDFLIARGLMIAESEANDTITLRAAVKAMVDFTALTHPREASMDGLIEYAAKTKANLDRLTEFTIRVGADITQIHVRALDGVAPREAIDAAIKALVAERGDLENCPAHTAHPREEIGEETRATLEEIQDELRAHANSIEDGFDTDALGPARARLLASKIDPILVALSSAPSTIDGEAAVGDRIDGVLSPPADVAGDGGPVFACDEQTSIPDDGKLIERLRAREKTPSGVGYGGFALRNPDGPEAAICIETLSREIEASIREIHNLRDDLDNIDERVRAETLEEAAKVADRHVQRARDMVGKCQPWGAGQAEWSRARDLGLDIVDELRSLTSGPAAGQDKQ